MPTSPRRAVEVDSLEAFDALAGPGAVSMAGWRLQDLDLTGRGDVLARLDPRGAVLLGCRVDPVVEERLRSGGALVFPSVPEVPLDVYRSRLYTPEELYAGLDDGYEVTPDARAYAWVRATSGPDGDLRDHLAQGLHDLAVDDALAELVRGRRVVGVMGGHAAARGSAGYRDAAVLGRALARTGLTVATGGGPGSMEAAHLGAHLRDHRDGALDEALGVLARVPGPTPSVTAWARAAFEVRSRWPSSTVSLGVPTWFYGHEPPAALASHLAKYVGNAVREDVLLHVCTAGVVFLPGQAGTVQEVFQDACENYYAAPGTAAPMVLVGTTYWTRDLPVWPLLQALVADREAAGSVHLVDDPAEVPGLLHEEEGRHRSAVPAPSVTWALGDGGPSVTWALRDMGQAGQTASVTSPPTTSRPMTSGPPSLPART